MLDKINYDVTLIITTYNEEKYLPILLGSIEKQKTKLIIEVIIVDDGSTDKTIEIVQKSINENSLRYNLIHNDKPHDVQYMRNLGLKHAKGTAVIFCDADVALGKYYIESMIRPIINSSVDTTLCRTYAVLEAFYKVRPEVYSKSYDLYLKIMPKCFFKRFPVQFFPWLSLWFETMRKNKKYVSIWSIPNRAHTTGIATRTSTALEVGGWNAKIGDGDDARYSYDIFSKSEKIFFVRKAILFISRRRVFPQDASWVLKMFFSWIINPYNKYLKKKRDNYSQSIR